MRGFTTALRLSPSLSCPAFLLSSGSGSDLPPRRPPTPAQATERMLCPHCCPPISHPCPPPAAEGRYGPELIPRGLIPIPSQDSGCGEGKARTLGAGRARLARTYDHCAIGDLLDEALLLQLADLEVECASAARERQQLPQQQRQQSGCPRSAPSLPGAGPGPNASRPAGPRHLPSRVRGCLCGACETANSGTDYKSQEPPRGLALRRGHASSHPTSEALFRAFLAPPRLMRAETQGGGCS